MAWKVSRFRRPDANDLTKTVLVDSISIDLHSLLRSHVCEKKSRPGVMVRFISVSSITIFL
jgi:hypothetical protein